METKSNVQALNSGADSHIYDVLIVGAGVSGIAAAIRLKKEGIDNFKVIEKAEGLGGTWRANSYPGCGCDVPSALYSYSFYPSHKWSHLFAKQPEILSYLQEVADHFDVTRYIEFSNGLEEARWDEERCLWRITTEQATYLAKTTIAATGPITEPQVPDIEGLDTFEGDSFHSARWNHDFDLTGKRVAVIGTGASAIQFVPQIQPKVKKLVVLQRTAPWVIPKPDATLGKTSKQFLQRFPAVQQTWRKTVSQSLNLINFGLRNPAVLRPVGAAAKQLLKRQVKDPVLRDAVTPNFTIGCKRLLFANDYYPALQAANTQLVPHGLQRVEPNAVIAANGERHEVDVIIWGTGFNVSHPPVGQKISNAKGERLSEVWKDQSPEAYLGAVLPDVPNAFLMLGPNILVYDSFIGIAEAQLNYIVEGVKQVLNDGLGKITIKPEVLLAHNRAVQKNLQGTVFNAGGCKSYYLDQHGRNFAAWPWSLNKLKQKLDHFDIAAYDVAYEKPKRRKAA